MTDVAPSAPRHLTVSALVLRTGQVLLVDDARGPRGCPGGPLEPGEDPEQALHRVVREQAGLDVAVVTEPRPAPAGVAVVAAPWTIQVENVPDHPSGGPHQHVRCIYVCTPAGDATDVPADHPGGAPRVRWMTIADVEATTAPGLAELLGPAAGWAARCGADVGVVPHAAWLASLPAHPVGASILFRDPRGRVLLVQPTYRLDGWQIPGGILEAGETPAATARREVREELGLGVEGDLRLVVVDWVSKPGARAIIQFTFDGGTLEPAAAESTIVLADGELADWTFAAPERWPQLLPGGTQRRVRAAIAAADSGTTAHLHDGHPAEVRRGQSSP